MPESQAPSTAEGPSAPDMIRLRAEQITLIQDAKGAGSGLFVSPDGWVLTNKHVAPSLGPYRVTLASGASVRGVGVHQSAHHDLALVKTQLAGVAYLDLERAVTDELRVGAEVFALGHPRGCRLSVARGIISNPHQEFDKEYFVQTDVSINPGNSGGPLVDRDGNLVGIVTMTLSNSQGLAFAVPGPTAADYVRHVFRLLRHGVVRLPEALFTPAPSETGPELETLQRALHAVVAAGRAQIEQEDPEHGYIKLRSKHAFAEVRAQQGLLQAWSHVATLGPSESQNLVFLARLLELNGARELGGAALTLRGGVLTATVIRPLAGLDSHEALRIVDLVLSLAAELPGRAHALLFTGAGAGPGSSGGASPGGPSAEISWPGAVPAPQPARPPADPGYPILTMPADPFRTG